VDHFDKTSKIKTEKANFSTLESEDVPVGEAHNQTKDGNILKAIR